jgi:phage gp37-like protein
MRYRVQDIEDQIIATLEADTTNFSAAMVDTYAGQIDARMFLNPEYMQGFIKLLPFALVSYQGRTAQQWDRDSSGKLYVHTLKFRVFVGDKSLRTTQEAARGCYNLLAGVYDDLHGKVPKSTPQFLPGYTTLSGTAITTTEFNCLSCLLETGGTDESLVVNLPGIVVYQADFSVRLVA